MAGAVIVGLHRDTDLADHRSHFGARLPQRLAGFQANLVRQLFLVSLKQFAEGFYHRLALGKTFPLPFQEGIAGLTHRRVHIFQVGTVALPDRFAGHRLDRFEGTPMALKP